MMVQAFALYSQKLTEERRKELVKDIKKKGEAAKVAVRNVRRDANDTLKKMEKSTDITEDERKEGEEKIQKMTDKYVAKIDKSVENKSKGNHDCLIIRKFQGRRFACPVLCNKIE